MKYAVTGGFGYSGSAIVQQLLEQGAETITLTNTPRKPDSPSIPAYPLRFDDNLTETLRGVDVLVNTYWVRFNHRNFTHQQAVEHSRILFASARRAGPATPSWWRRAWRPRTSRTSTPPSFGPGIRTGTSAVTWR